MDQLLSGGARFIGKAVSDELAFSLLGENHFYGSPLNPKAPKRVSGGSSSGSVAAVACGLVDFALGTDTGGSVRVPASNSGVWGMRPSHGFISVAGVMPFAPSFDTVGIHASSAEILARVARVLLGSAPSNPVAVTSIHVLRDAFALLEPSVKNAHSSVIELLRQTFGDTVRETSLIEIVGDEASAPFETWYDTYCLMQWSEIENSLGPWIAESKPSFGAATAKNFDLVKNLDRTRVAAAIVQRENLFRKMQEFLGPGDLLCIPTTPSPAPIKGSMGMNQRSGPYYGSVLSLTSIAGICRLPQISMPLSTVQAEDGDVPLGLSILGKFGEDSFVLDVAQKISLLSPEHST